MSTETPKSELKPCPFCGSPAGKVEHHITPQLRPDGSIYESRSVQCSRIFKGCMGAGPIKGSEAEAVEAWNARATDAELSRVTEERDAALAELKALRGETLIEVAQSPVPYVEQLRRSLRYVENQRDAALRRVEEVCKLNRIALNALKCAKNAICNPQSEHFVDEAIARLDAAEKGERS